MELINFLDKSLSTIQVNYCEYTVTSTFNDKTEIIPITGIIIKPLWYEVKPKDIRILCTRKNETTLSNEQIFLDLSNGIYYLNIIDYTDQEILKISDLVTTNLLEKIWTCLIKVNDDGNIISLNNDVLLKHIILKNETLFKNESEFLNFCTERGLRIENFITPAIFSNLDMILEEVSLRIEMEQFFARKYLFSETLIQKIQKKINGHYSIDNERIIKLENWIKDLQAKNRIYQEYKDFQKLYDMPMNSIHNENVTVVNGDVYNSSFSNNKSINSESKFDKKIKIWGLIVAIIAVIIPIIIEWEKVKAFFKFIRS